MRNSKRTCNFGVVTQKLGIGITDINFKCAADLSGERCCTALPKNSTVWTSPLKSWSTSLKERDPLLPKKISKIRVTQTFRTCSDMSKYDPVSILGSGTPARMSFSFPPKTAPKKRFFSHNQNPKIRKYKRILSKNGFHPLFLRE